MQPDAGELRGAPPRIDLPVEEVGHGRVVERDTDDRADLRHEQDVFDKQRVLKGRPSEASDFGVAPVTQKQELGPRIRGEPE
jgi:hypothetical protein